jgi:hypothetical protein
MPTIPTPAIEVLLLCWQRRASAKLLDGCAVNLLYGLRYEAKADELDFTCPMTRITEAYQCRYSHLYIEQSLDLP